MRLRLGAVLVVLLLVVLARAPTAFADGSIDWTGQGATGGVPDTADCSDLGAGQILFVLTGADDVTSATITVNGVTYDATSQQGNNIHFVVDATQVSSAFVTYEGTLSDSAQLVISHGCPEETPTATATTAPTATATATTVPTATATATTVPTATATATSTPAATATPENTATPTATATKSPTATATATSTTVPTATGTATTVPTATATGTAAPTATGTIVPTATGTAPTVPTATATTVPTATGTAVPTASATATSTTVPTAIATTVPTATATATTVPEVTPTPTATTPTGVLPNTGSGHGSGGNGLLYMVSGLLVLALFVGGSALRVRRNRR